MGFQSLELGQMQIQMNKSRSLHGLGHIRVSAASGLVEGSRVPQPTVNPTSCQSGTEASCPSASWGAIAEHRESDYHRQRGRGGCFSPDPTSNQPVLTPLGWQGRWPLHCPGTQSCCLLLLLLFTCLFPPGDLPASLAVFISAP